MKRFCAMAGLTALLFLVTFWPGLDHAQAKSHELRRLYRGARAQAMGGAFVGLADDEQALFYNPAGMAGNPRTSFKFLNLDLHTSTDILSIYQEGTEAFQNFSADSLQILMGKNIYAQAQTTSIFLAPGFGLGLLVDGQTAFFSQNTVFPQFEIGYQTTNGIQAAFGTSVGKRRKKSGELRVGIGGKMLYRRGGYHDLQISQLVSANTQLLKQMTGAFKVGYGLDLGAQYIKKLKNGLKLSAGTSFTDVGDTTFRGAGPDPIRGNWTLGVAAQMDLIVMNIIAAYDFSHILEDTDWRRKNHLGFEFKLPMIALYAGLHETYFTYGTSFSFWFFKITALTYAEELGVAANQEDNRRYLLKLALKFDI